MSEGVIPIKRMIPIIVVTWIISLITTLAIVYFLPNIFPIEAHIDDEAIITAKLADGSVTSAKILNGAITAYDLDDSSIITAKIVNGAVTTQKIQDEAVTTEKIEDSAIVTIKLADGSVTSAKILDGSVTAIDLATNAVTTVKIADGAVTNVKLAPQAIPFASTYKTDTVSTTETAQYVDMSGMSVTLKLSRKSHLLIMFSAEAYPDWDEWILIRALVGQDVAHPGEIYLTPTVWGSDYESYIIDWGAYTYNFYQPSVDAGTYNIKIQWQVSGGVGDIGFRTLNVIALPT